MYYVQVEEMTPGGPFQYHVDFETIDDALCFLKDVLMDENKSYIAISRDWTKLPQSARTRRK